MSKRAKRLMFTIGGVIAAVLVVAVVGVAVLVGAWRYSVESAHKGVEAVQAAALQDKTGDELVAIGRRFGLNVIFAGDGQVQDSLAGAVTHPPPGTSAPSAKDVHIGERSGVLTLWGGYVFDRWFCDVELEHGRLKPYTRPQVYFLD